MPRAVSLWHKIAGVVTPRNCPEHRVENPELMVLVDALIPVLCRPCEESWDSNGETQDSCVSKDIKPDDLTKPCRLFIRELEFNKELGKKRNQSAIYNMMDINDLTKMSGTPIEILIRIKKKKKHILFHCGKTQLSDAERKKGWCATHMDDDGT